MDSRDVQLAFLGAIAFTVGIVAFVLINVFYFDDKLDVSYVMVPVLFLALFFSYFIQKRKLKRLSTPPPPPPPYPEN